MKDAIFLGDTLKAIRAFPADARRMAGRQIDRVQQGEDPADWKPLATIGPGVREIRIRERSGAFRVVYLATLPDAVLIIAAFRKTSQKTPARRDREGAQQVAGLPEERIMSMKAIRYKNVWDALEDDPAERQRLKMRALLLDALQARVKTWNVTQAEAAKRLGITQPRLNDLLKDRFNKFSLGALFDLATRAGLKVKLSIEDGRDAPKGRKAA